MAASYRSPDPATRRASWLLYLGVALFLVLMALTFRAVAEAWRDSQAHGRAEAVFDLVEVVTPMRPHDTPGALAWLDHEIRRYERSRLGSSDPDQLRASAAADPGTVPEALQPVLDAMTRPVGGAIVGGREAWRWLEEAEIGGPGAGPGAGGELPALPAGLRFRSQRFLAWQGGSRLGGAGLDGDAERWLVVTRRRVLDEVPGPAAAASDRFLSWAAPYLVAVHDALEPPRLSLPARYVRIYAVAEDGTFLSLPWIPRPEARHRTVWEEGRELRKRTRLPNFVPNEFFFRFDFAPPAEPAHYSGLYLDLGGHGLVTTLTLPLQPADGPRAVAAIDLSFDIDWRDVARQIEPPLVAHLVALEEAPPPTGWQPWGTLARHADERVPPALGLALDRLAENERRAGAFVNPGQHHVGQAGNGTVGTFQVAHREWLVVLFPALPARFPWLAVTLLTALGVLLIFGFESNRRRAVNELQQRQNLLETLRVPLVVVDPNTDRVIYGNDAARDLGLEPEVVVGERVDDRDGAEREHYERMQRASVTARRAYGVPLRVPAAGGGVERRWAVVRSVAVAAPIESLRADEHHRLGLFFLIEPETDLALYAAELEGAVRNDERRRLAGLLSHGVDTLAQVLRARLEAGERHDPFTVWLGDYLGRRIAVAAWLLDHWHAVPPLPGAVSVGPEAVRSTLDRFQEVFAVAGRDPDLRARLHWANGVLSRPSGEVPSIEVRLDWPDRFLFTCPVKGGVGFFLGEVLVNAVRHGRPGDRPVFSALLDPVRREVLCEISNSVGAAARHRSSDLEPYGGQRILQRLATLFSWRDLAFEAGETRYRVRWSVAVSERAAPGDGD